MYSVELKVNWDHKRCKHALERMWLRGISLKEVEQAILKGKKHVQEEKGLTEALYQYYSVVYREYIHKKLKLRKVYPITVKLW